jgi:acetyl-CoA synthetase
MKAHELEGNGVSGNLCLAGTWPGQARTILGRPPALRRDLLLPLPRLYFTGDGCRRDEDGYYWITGRVDDVINVAGHRLGTAEIESALVAHEPSPRPPSSASRTIKGTRHLRLRDRPRRIRRDPARRDRGRAQRAGAPVIGPIATPDRVQIVSGLPKTRSGKIMRRILRMVAAGRDDGFGDTSTLADPSVVDELLAAR